MLALTESFTSQIDQRKPKSIYVVIPPIDNKIAATKDSFPNGYKNSISFKNFQKSLLQQQNIAFIDCFDINDLGEDGLHLNAEAHLKLANCLSKKIFELSK